MTVTDQAGKQRKSVTDGLGRLIQIYEDPNGLNYLTSYGYDTLDNLTNVTQGTQTPRSFSYDSLKRLTSAWNPESNTASYQYDNNGNVTQKTDPRAVVSTYGYDALNRNISISYSDSTPSVTRAYDGAVNGKGRFWYNVTWSGDPSKITHTAIDVYDALGRVRNWRQHFWVNGTWTQPPYSMAASYDLAGHLTSMTYPSGHTVNYSYDSAGRANSVTGNLGDGGASRNYSTGISYSALGGMSQEQLGTTTPIYNKLFYNSRGQLSEIREGLTPNNTSWQRGAIINFYSPCWGMCGGSNSTTPMPNNNGNLKIQQVFIPQTDASDYEQHYDVSTQFFEYDALNRLQFTNEASWKQWYSYDRYGNRTIDQANTFGAGIPNPYFGVDPTTNRLTPAGGYTMNYDGAGNLAYDDYTGQGARTFDAENRMTGSAGVSPASYVYDADGHRVKRIVNSTETWQVYGIGGELIAEYAANGNPLSPQKEYGYRNGQLLITATVTAGGWGTPPSYTGPNPLSTGDQIKLENLTELRSAVNQLRQHAGLSAFNFTVDPNPQQYQTTVRAEHIRQLRTALEQARTALGLSIGGYEHPMLQENSSWIYAIDFQELRNQILSAWNSGTGGVDIRWLVSDQLGTPRMIFDQSGSLATTSRHDYLPFGEELFAGTGGRTTAQGYTGDNVRQKFTQKERDIETGLDFFEARYFGGSQGRFTSPDPLGGHTEDPQTLDRYSYVRNNPERFTDPTGLDFYLTCNKEGKTCHDSQQGTYDKKGNFTATLIRNDKNGGLLDQKGNRYTANITGKGVWFTQAGGGQSTLGVFQNGTNATTIQGSASNGLEGFTFNFTASNLNHNQTASGTWSFNGTDDRAERALELAGYIHHPADDLNPDHPSTITYDAVDYRSDGEAHTGVGSGHFTVHEPVRYELEPVGPFAIRTRRQVRDTVPTAGDVHLGEHNPFASWEAFKLHQRER